MKIETGEELAKKLNQLCNNMRKRLWISSPFIGDFTTARRILGRKWLDNAKIEVRLIIDKDNTSLNPNTIKNFHDVGDVKSIKGLHAKIYIVDNYALLTSANLTNTAFSKRYEVGVFLSKAESRPVIKLYDIWWKNVAENISPDWTPKIPKRTAKKEDEPVIASLKSLWRLPADPGNPSERIAHGFRNYDLFLRSYKEFAQKYSSIQRLWKDVPLYFETDSFLNYLYHHAKRLPSKRYRKTKARRLTEKQKIREIKKYAKLFKAWLSSDDERKDYKDHYLESSKEIKTILSKKHILNIKKSEVKKVVTNLNCMGISIQRHRFLNPKNNKIHTIRKSWKFLLYDENIPIQNRMNLCKNELNYFSYSSIGEILGFFKPSKFPLRNGNSIAGMRFFGYNVPLH